MGGLSGVKSVGPRVGNPAYAGDELGSNPVPVLSVPTLVLHRELAVQLLIFLAWIDARFASSGD